MKILVPAAAVIGGLLLSACSSSGEDTSAGVVTSGSLAVDVSVQSDLRQATAAVEAFEVEHAGAFPASYDELVGEGLRVSARTQMWLVGNGEMVCVSAWNPSSSKAPDQDATFRWDSRTRTVMKPGSVGQGACAGVV